MSAPAPKKKGDLSITALYTSETWTWGRLPCADLLAMPEARMVFRVTNAALFVAGLFRRDLPSLRHSLLHRHAMIDRLVRDARPAAVLELASGLSRRGATLSADPAVTYVELDLPHVVDKKRALLDRTEEGKAVLARDNFRLVSGDVRETSLAELLPGAGPKVVIAEGLLMYFKPAEQRELWSRVRALLPDDGLFVFDLVPACEQPPPGFVGRTLEGLMKAFTGGKAFERDERSRDDVAADLRSAGFTRVEMIEPRAVAKDWSLPFAEARTQQLLFVCRA